MAEGGSGDVQATPIAAAVVAGEAGGFWWSAKGGSWSQSPEVWVVEVWAAEGFFLLSLPVMRQMGGEQWGPP